MEYKFRFYDKEDKVMRYFTLDEMLERHFAYYGSYDLKVLKEEKMQYIGLNDDNGKEIYVGDIISIDCYSYDEPIDYVVGEIVYSKGNACYCINGKGEMDYDYAPLLEVYGEYKTIYKVLGNIYENPELLEGEEQDV